MIENINIKQCEGKTIQRIYLDEDCLVLKYSDNTFSHIKAYSSYDSASIESDDDFDYNTISKDVSIDLGLFTLDEYNIDKKKRDDRNKANFLRSKEMEYQRLKKELGYD